MRLRRLKKYAIGAGGMLVLVMAILLSTGWGSAVAAQISNVFVTNDASHPVPVHEQGTASVAVAGRVDTRVAIPASGFSIVAEVHAGITRILNDASNTSYAITSVTFENDDGAPHDFDLFTESNSDCTAHTDVHAGPSAKVPAQDTIHLDFPQPFVIPTTGTDQSCLDVSTDEPVGSITVVGYRLSRND